LPIAISATLSSKTRAWIRQGQKTTSQLEYFKNAILVHFSCTVPVHIC
jgi:hypothetical protein